MDPFFLPRDAGACFCTHHAPADSRQAARAALVFVHACGEEMNKSRRMVALQARALAQAGCAVLTIDLSGCGDSSGLLQDAHWGGWQADIDAACTWLAARHPGAPLWLWGQRAGALLASQVAAARAQPPHLLLWQPLLAGKAQVQQLLRMKAAAGLADGVQAGAAMAGLRQALARDEAVEIGGYTWPAALLQALETATLRAPPPPAGTVWIEVSSRPGAELSPASLTLLQAWRSAGSRVDARVAAGPAFWQTAEIELAPDLLAATVAAVLNPDWTAA